MKFNIFRSYAFIILFVLFTTPLLKAKDLSVKNVRFKTKGENVVVLYDLEGKIEKKYKINLAVSDDNGTTFRIKPKTMNGDVGKNIKQGSGKEIIWFVHADYPEGLRGKGFVFAVEAELQSGMGKWPYILGAGAVGTIVYFLTPKDKEDTPKTGSIVIDIPN